MVYLPKLTSCCRCVQLEVKIELADAGDEAVSAALTVPIPTLVLRGTDALIDEVSAETGDAGLCASPKLALKPFHLFFLPSFFLPFLFQIKRLREEGSASANSIALLTSKLAQAETAEEQIRGKLSQLAACLDEMTTSSSSTMEVCRVSFVGHDRLRVESRSRHNLCLLCLFFRSCRTFSSRISSCQG